MKSLLPLLLCSAFFLTRIDSLGLSCRCSKILSEVCGEDDVTYANECLADCQGVSARCKGRCPCQRIIHDPGFPFCPCDPPSGDDSRVCGVDGRVYNSPCEASCSAVKVACVGRCPCGQNVCPCPDVVRSVCGSDGLTYRNECEANCQGAKKVCEGGCPCQDGDGGSQQPLPPPAALRRQGLSAIGVGNPMNPSSSGQGQTQNSVDPAAVPSNPMSSSGSQVPSSNNATVGDPSAASVALPPGNQFSNSMSSNPALVANGPCSCFGDEQPVCGSDGLTYPNECVAGCLNIQAICPGNCPCSQSVPFLAGNPDPLRLTLQVIINSGNRIVINRSDQNAITRNPKGIAGHPSILNAQVGNPSNNQLENSNPTNPSGDPSNNSVGNPSVNQIGNSNDQMGSSSNNPMQNLNNTVGNAMNTHFPNAGNLGVNPQIATSSNDCASKCHQAFNMVCGADGQSYPNDCVAGCSNVDVLCQGTCPCAPPVN